MKEENFNEICRCGRLLCACEEVKRGKTNEHNRNCAD